jgi:hypothetical protein
MKASVARSILVCVGLLAFASLVLPSISDAVGRTDVLAVWLFDEGSGDMVTDSSGKGHDGSFVSSNDIPGPEWAAGRFGGGLHFPEGGQNWVVMNNPVLPLETVDITMGVWVKPGGTQNTHANILSSHAGFRGIAFEQAGDELNRFNVPIGTAGADENLRAKWSWNTENDTLNSQLVTDEWNHFVVTKAGGRTTQYVNGEITVEADIDPGTVLQSDRFFIGSGRTWADDSGRWFNGTIDDAFIFTRALSQGEIQSAMNNGIADTTAVSPADKMAAVWGKIKTRHQ